MKRYAVFLFLFLLTLIRPVRAEDSDTVLRLSAMLHTPRSVHTATLLTDGTVLIAGGMTDGERFLDDAELFDPITGTFSVVGQMTEPRSTHAAILLDNGKVLLVGGYGQGRLASAELYDPATRTFSFAGTMNAPREGFTATLLSNGQVLIAGGYGRSYRESLTSAEVYDPQTNTFTLVGSMTEARASFAAARLDDGRVLVIGGRSGNQLVAEAEVYDPTTQHFTPTGSLITARHKHAAVTLTNGEVLVIGGATIETAGVKGQFDSLELYDPRSGTFTLAPAMYEARYKILDAVTTFPDGRVIIAGAGETIEVYDPNSDALTQVDGSLGTEWFYATATRLDDGTVLITGGYDGRLRATDMAWLAQPRVSLPGQ